MNSPTARALSCAFVLLSSYCISSSKARADDWGCQVLLCLSNPGGPMQFAECVPPVQRLWNELARGRPFPTCNGVGLQTSRPGYEPYSCETGYRLTARFGPQGQEAACVSATRQVVDSSQCTSGAGAGSGAARWVSGGGQHRCMAYVTAQPSARAQPHFIDVMIDGAGTQRVWF
ncbi:MAG: hypothetical protein B7Y01_03200 [Xanthobacter sp. 17-67-6]|jgi:hypothetical protein|uniref:hypothetical protein n=1 Tax=Xanthobacteraceae TaxID=335928 RepID=UPI000BCE6F25|nr:MAG: hypothetical protein B7Y01_03200 [Xanthobacter sp. 17-67-6]OZA91543.1 MAG: hypothetical protein B7X76_02145 [Azorhizobium sp. 39-67-5]